MRLLVFAYHDVGYVCLRHLIEQAEEVIAVVTHADSPNESIWWRSVVDLARDHGIETATPDDVNTSEFVERVRAWRPELAFSFYFRQLISADLLAVPPLGCFNLHGSLLPKYAGRVPVNWVLVHGETETGVTLHEMTERPDAGAIVAQRRVPIAFTDTAKTLFDKVTVSAEALLAETWPLLKHGTAPRIPQDFTQRSYFGSRRPADGLLNWGWPALRLYNLVRAITHPYPGAFTYCAGRKLFVWQCWPLAATTTAAPGTIVESHTDGLLVATGEGVLLIRAAQFAGEIELTGGALDEHSHLKLGAQFTEE